MEAGHVRVTGSSSVCALPGKCSWFPMVVAMPSIPEYRCGYGTAVALDIDPNTQQVWTGLPAHASDGSFAGEVTSASIIPGLYGQRLCLASVGTHMVNDVVCEVQAKVFEEFGSGPISCPPIEKPFEEDIVSILPTVQTPTVAAPTETTSTKPKLRRCPKPKRRVVRHGKVRCVPRRHRKPKR